MPIAMTTSIISSDESRTTSFEILNDGALSVLQLRQNILDDKASTRLIGQTLNFYDGQAFQGLPFGEIGDFGALVRSESLVLTDDILQAAYGNAQPPYLQPSPNWTADYPEEFKTLLPLRAGYVYHTGGAYATGYFAVTQQQRYDFHAGKGRGLITATRDPLGRETTIGFDKFSLLPTEVTDPVGLITKAVYDYRVLQPKEVTDPNSNRSAFAFTPLGLLGSTAVMGKLGENAGDTLETPGTRMVYDFHAFAKSGEPISCAFIKRSSHQRHGCAFAGTRRRLRRWSIPTALSFIANAHASRRLIFGDHFGDAGLPSDQTRNGDAIGQQRAANDPPRVAVSGWQTYDNKGRVVEKYEPFFSMGFDYAQPTDTQFGQKATMFYDPRGQVIRTVNPNGSVARDLRRAD
jgi:hypothetical protein